MLSFWIIIAVFAHQFEGKQVSFVIFYIKYFFVKKVAVSFSDDEYQTGWKKSLNDKEAWSHCFRWFLGASRCITRLEVCFLSLDIAREDCVLSQQESIYFAHFNLHVWLWLHSVFNILKKSDKR